MKAYFQLGDAAQLVECLSNIQEALGSVPSTTYTEPGGAHPQLLQSSGDGRKSSSSASTQSKFKESSGYRRPGLRRSRGRGEKAHFNNSKMWKGRISE